MSTERVVKFRVVYRNEVNGYERLTQKDGSIHWEWMCLGLNPDNGTERWCPGVYPKGYKYIRNQFTGFLDKNGKEIYAGDKLNVGLFALNDTAKFGKECWKNLPEGVNENDLSTITEILTVNFSPKDLYWLHRIINDNPDVVGVEVIGHIYSPPSPIKRKQP